MWFFKKNKAPGTNLLPENMMPIQPAKPRRSPLMNVQIGYWSDSGRVREVNEDSYHFSQEASASWEQEYKRVTAVIADGMGGLECGEKASQYTVEGLCHLLAERVYPQFRTNHPVEQEKMVQLLKDCVQIVNGELYHHFHSLNQQAGSTLTAVTMIEDKGYVLHVGDSRLYAINLEKDTFSQITTDHSFVERLVKLGQLTRKEARHHPRSNEIYKMMGIHDQVDPDVFEIQLQPGDSLLLCSDGLTDMMDDEEIFEVLKRGESPQSAVEDLGKLANEKGGLDNCTILYIKTSWLNEGRG